MNLSVDSDGFQILNETNESQPPLSSSSPLTLPLEMSLQSPNTSASKLPNYASFQLDSAGKNYQTWKKVINVLLSNETDCVEVVNGLIPMADTRFQKANTLARGIILNSIDFNLLTLKFPLDVSQMTAADVYTTIVEEFETVNGSRLNAAMGRVFQFQFDPRKTPNNNINEFRKLQQDVTSLGGTLDQTMLISRLLEALPSSWQSFKQSWTVVPKQSQNLTNLYELIKVEQTRLSAESRSHPQPQAQQAFITQSRNKFRPNNHWNNRQNHSYSQFQLRDFNPSRNAPRPSNTNIYYSYNPPALPNTPNFQRPRFNNHQNTYRDNQPRNNQHPQNQHNNASQQFNRRPNNGQRNNNHGNRVQPRANIAESSPILEQNIFTASTAELPRNSDTWVVDSGASNHFCNSMKYFSHYEELEDPIEVKVGGSQRLRALGTGTVEFEVMLGNKRHIVRLDKTFYVPSLRRNLVSVSSLTRSGWTVNASEEKMTLSRNQQTLTARIQDGLYFLKIDGYPLEANISIINSNPTLQQAHEAFGHINKHYVKKILTRNKISYKKDEVMCEPCLQGKLSRVPYHSRPMSTKPQ